ncbi:hypothetical protein B0I26_10567 [Anoxybacillus vitaminiphilus]|uniref:Uncharacterized protein n=1 Tax=Paranoxybacillus vitaminiphilus TaxID=581036 RepID=A0A327YJE1_9BACL|nr:hypothetical protein B0I26_10567 [Anoxybacillus vitaminiphilus]
MPTTIYPERNPLYVENRNRFISGITGMISSVDEGAIIHGTHSIYLCFATFLNDEDTKL